MFWAGSGRKDAPKIHSADISYIITILLSSIKLPSKLATTMGTQSGQAVSTGKQFLTVGEPFNVSHRSMKQLKDLLQISSLLGMQEERIRKFLSFIFSRFKSLTNWF
jgi:hypothetical protein